MMPTARERGKQSSHADPATAGPFLLPVEVSRVISNDHAMFCRLIHETPRLSESRLKGQATLRSSYALGRNYLHYATNQIHQKP